MFAFVQSLVMGMFRWSAVQSICKTMAVWSDGMSSVVKVFKISPTRFADVRMRSGRVAPLKKVGSAGDAMTRLQASIKAMICLPDSFVVLLPWRLSSG